MGGFTGFDQYALHPILNLAACGVCPLSTIFTIRSRPCDVRRAFLWTFIRFLPEWAVALTPSASLGWGRVDNLLKAHT